ncbi:hypothetical protein DVT68_20075 [Dyella solisilvae]|uniref:Uncharacterized protein n=1 Tax=Dyella solisilvae TaxID=1920168 RepID=A0A370K2C0_9GAMM|nr:hypothetical protein [Dyella solisilvae]RDI96803.1 hypothetical protein DVT68_20075 [Dyella solisilvae]
MQTERTHPVLHALTVARACVELAQEAMIADSFPKAVAATLSAAANDAAARLSQFRTTYSDIVSSELMSIAFRAQTDLAAISALAGLVATYKSAPRNASYIAKKIRNTAADAIDYLAYAEVAMDL